MIFRNKKLMLFIFLVFTRIYIMGQMPKYLPSPISIQSSCFEDGTSSGYLARRGGARNPLNFYKNERSQSDRKQYNLQSQVNIWGGRAQAAGAQMVQRQAAEANFTLANIALDLEREAHRSCQEIIIAYCSNRRALSQGRNIVVGQEELTFLQQRYWIDRRAADTATSQLPIPF